jgi:enamine deaminase RidA (YjgF/YER057c/UK114 family)
MSNIVCILRDADMVFSDVVQLNFFVRSRNDYATARSEFGKVWRKHSDRHFPAMAMFMVEGLYEPDALIEIQGIACSESS